MWWIWDFTQGDGSLLLIIRSWLAAWVWLYSCWQATQVRAWLGTVSGAKNECLFKRQQLVRQRGIQIREGTGWWRIDGLGPLFRRSAIPKVHYSEGPLFRRSAIPKVHYSEGPLFRRLGFGWVGHEGSDPVGLYHIAVFPRTYSLTHSATLTVIQTPTLTQI
jgi:hypothetical protein